MRIVKEKVFDISLKDVNEIIDSVEKTIFKIFPNWDSINTKFFKVNNLNNQILIDRIENFAFNSIECQAASSKIPLQINFGLVKSNVMYPPLSNTDSTYPYIINFGFNIFDLRDLKTIILKNNLSDSVLFKEFNQSIPIQDRKNFDLIFSKERLRNGLTHELTHWLDDFYHNEAIRKIAVLQKFNNKTEINAQIHVISMLKIRNEDKWDRLTIFDILSMDSSLKDTYRALSEIGKKEAISWVKTLLKRMYREKLLGKKMNFIPSNDQAVMEDFHWENKFNEKYYNIGKYL